MYTELINKAKKARENAYAPYSEFKVGAALLCKDGKIYTGCNIENISYGATNCAERTAIFKAVSEGEYEFEAIAIVGGKDKLELTSPCGMCRQVMSEFCDSDFKIILADDVNQKEYLLEELLPLSFDNIKN